MSLPNQTLKRTLVNGDSPQVCKVPRIDINPVSLLNEKIGINNIKFMEVSVSGPPHAPEFVVECAPAKNHSNETLKLLSITKPFLGTGNSKQKAKQEAASVMLKALLEVNPLLLEPKRSSNSKFTVDDLNGPGCIKFQSEKKEKSPTMKRSIENIATLSPTVTNSPASILNLKNPLLKYNIKDETVAKTLYFVCTIDINGETIRGEGRSKQIAKQNAANAVLRSVYGIDVYSMTQSNDSELNSSLSSEEQSIFADNFQFMVNDKYKEVCKSIDKNYSDHKVLAGILITRPSSVENSEKEDSKLLCVTSGTKALGGKHLCLKGKAINDCHAEILARRCLQSFLHRQMLYLLGDISKEEFGDEWVILQRVPDKGQFELINGIKFHLYISSAPCGDSRIFTMQANDTVTDDHPLRSNKSLLRCKIECGEGTIPNQSETGIQTFDGIINGERLLTMSCSDKVCSWNCLGLQGALLSHLLEQPIYLSSIVLGSLFNRAHLKRALYDRVSKMEFPELAIETGFNAVCPDFMMASSLKERTTKKSPNSAVNWFSGDLDVEVISSDKGRLINGDVSRLSKAAMMKRFLKVIRLLEDNPEAYSGYNYGQLKRLYGSSIYLDSKKQFSKHFSQNNLGVWVSKPVEQDDFYVD